MKRVLPTHQVSLYYFIISVLLISILTILPLNAQSYKITGAITVPTTSVQNANVTFIDVSDTTKKYSAVTDANGNYEVDVVVTAVSPVENSLPTKFELDQNYPNPFLKTLEMKTGLQKIKYHQIHWTENY